MISAVRQDPADAPAVEPLETWLTRHAFVMLGAVAVAGVTRSGVWLALAAVASFTMLHRWNGGTLDRIRVADVMTLSRLAVLLLAAAALPGLDRHWVLAAFAVNVAIDSVDGRVARARGEATRAGALLDRETDAFFVLTAYAYLHWVGDAGVWVLGFGALPYLYRILVVAIAAELPADHKERLAAPLAAANFVLLLAAVAVPSQARYIVVASAVVLAVSFGGSLWNLSRHAHSPR